MITSQFLYHVAVVGVTFRMANFRLCLSCSSHSQSKSPPTLLASNSFFVKWPPLLPLPLPFSFFVFFSPLKPPHTSHTCRFSGGVHTSSNHTHWFFFVWWLFYLQYSHPSPSLSPSLFSLLLSFCIVFRWHILFYRGWWRGRCWAATIQLMSENLRPCCVVLQSCPLLLYFNCFLWIHTW